MFSKCMGDNGNYLRWKIACKGQHQSWECEGDKYHI